MGEKVIGRVADFIRDEPKEAVREAAIKVFLHLDPVDLAKHASQIAEIMGNDESNFVRLWALICLSKLPVDDLCDHEDAIQERWDDAYMPIREKAHQLLKSHRLAMGRIQPGDE